MLVSRVLIDVYPADGAIIDFAIMALPDASLPYMIIDVGQLTSKPVKVTVLSSTLSPPELWNTGVPEVFIFHPRTEYPSFKLLDMFILRYGVGSANLFPQRIWNSL